MTIDGDVLEIELDMELDDVLELKAFVTPRLEYIESIEVIGARDRFASSSLFALLYSIKQSKPGMKIPILDGGKLELSDYGTLHWIRHD